MQNIQSTVIDTSLRDWAKGFCQERKASIDYFLKFGNPLEKALVQKVIELAGGKT